MTAVTTMRDHWWWRPGWRRGRSAYTWHVTTDLHPAVDRLTDAYREVLEALPGLDMVPTRWLHLTMQGIGFTDEVASEDVARIVQAARDRCATLTTPVSVTLGPAEVGSEGCTLYARPADPLIRVRGQLRTALADVWGADRAPEPDAYHPHVSLAYSNTDTPAQPLADRLAAHPVEPVTLEIGSVQLIDLSRDEHVYTWTTVAGIPLGGAEHCDDRL